MRKLTKKEFIKKAREVHGDKYDYSKVEYINAKTKVCIICPEHGEFWQTPYKHINLKRGCHKCGGTAKLNTIEFIEKAKQVHENIYDYSKVEYINNRTKVCIICPIHGEFWMTPVMHLRGHGCKECSKEKLPQFKTKTLKEFVEKAKEVHGEKYDYSKVEYIDNHTKVCIICPTHGEFWQLPANHYKYGCFKCANEKKKITKEEFIEKAKEVHGDKYDYSKVEYKNCETKVCIICFEHSEFWQRPNDHLHGRGCPLCQSSHLEEEIRLFLQNNNIDFEFQQHFDWLGKQSLDFYLPQYNAAIECQGIQHFQSVDWFGGHNGLLQTKIRDNLKRKLCSEHGIRLLYYSNLGIDYPYEVIEDKEKLLEEIKKV